MGRYDWKQGAMIRKVLRVGNSYMVAIPPYYLERLELKKGDEVVLEIVRKEGAEWGEIIIRPLTAKGKATTGGLQTR